MPKRRSKGFANPAQTWDARFSADEYIFGTEPNVWLAQHQALLAPGSQVLAVADGEGRNSVWLAQQGMHVDAFDISPVGVAKARKLADSAGVAVNFTICDCNDWDWQANRYDAVVAIFIQFADPEMRARIFEQTYKTLKPGGLFILQGYTPKQLEYKTGGPSLVEHLYTEELITTLAKDFKILELVSYEKELSEGPRHTGMSALLGLVARK